MTDKSLLKQGLKPLTTRVSVAYYRVPLFEYSKRLLVKGFGDLPIMFCQSIRSELLASAEPDQCYYISNEQLVRGKTVNLAVDPLPDLVVELGIAHIDKNILYSAMGVPEFWRYDGQVLRIYQLREARYQETQMSLAFSKIAKDLLYQFLQDCNEQGETVSKRQLRDRLND